MKGLHIALAAAALLLAAAIAPAETFLSVEAPLNSDNLKSFVLFRLSLFSGASTDRKVSAGAIAAANRSAAAANAM